LILHTHTHTHTRARARARARQRYLSMSIFKKIFKLLLNNYIMCYVISQAMKFKQ